MSLQSALLLIAALLAVAVGAAHSYLGERYLLRRLFRSDGLPKLFGGTEFTKRTLRFAWHVTTIAWWGFAALLFAMSRGPLGSGSVLAIIGATFLITAVITLAASRGRHLAWPVFLAIGAISLFTATTL